MRRRLYIPLLLSYMLFPFILVAQQQEKIFLSEHGIIPGSGHNASPIIKKVLEQCIGKRNLTIVFPPGKIDFWPDSSFARELYVSNATEDDSQSKIRNIGILLENLEDIRIEGNNTLIILHGKMVSFAIINCRNIRISGLAFDMQRPTMSEMSINSVTTDSVLATIHPDSKYKIANGKIFFYGEGWHTNKTHTILFDSTDQTMKYSSFKPFEQSLAIEKRPGTILFKGSFSGAGLAPGNVLTIRDPYRDNCGAFISLSRDIYLDRVNMHYMHGLGIVAQFSENLSYRNIRVAPREGSGRLISAFADCFHFSGCKGRILIDSCTTSGSHDDPVNVHGTHLKITGIDSSGTIKVRFMHHQTYGFNAFFKGDSIAFIEPETLRPLSFAKLKNATLINSREMELQLDPGTLKNITPGICVENISWYPDLIIRNSRFDRTNTRGILVTTTKKVVIENNVFQKTGMHAILIANDASSWYESGAVRDVTIRNNLFVECGYNSAPGGYVISLAPENHKYVEGYSVHRNVIIENNVFRIADPPLLGAKSVNGLSFRNNSIHQTGSRSSRSETSSIRLDRCDDVVIGQNKFITTWIPEVLELNMKNSKVQSDIRR